MSEADVGACLPCQLVAGAVGVSTATTALVALLDVAGVVDIFVAGGVWVALELVVGFVVLTVVVFVAAAGLQWLSFYTPLPPVVDVDRDLE